MTRQTLAERRAAGKERMRRNRAVTKFCADTIHAVGDNPSAARDALRADSALTEALLGRLAKLESEYGKTLYGGKLTDTADPFYPSGVDAHEMGEWVRQPRRDTFERGSEPASEPEWRFLSYRDGVMVEDLAQKRKKGDPLQREITKAQDNGFITMRREAEAMMRASRELIEWRKDGLTSEDRLITAAPKFGKAS